MRIHDRITEYFAAHRAEIVRDLSALCAIPSVEGEPLPGMPYGRAVDEALRAAEGMFAREGFVTERDPMGRYALVHYGVGEKTIGIFAHCDVVPAGDGWTVTEPFAPVVRGRALFARGVHDNKGGVVATLYLLMAFRDLGIDPGCRITVFLGGNEETGMSDLEAFRRANAAPDISLVPDNNPPVSLGEKGRTAGWLASPPVLRVIEDFTGGEAFNVVLDSAEARLEYSDGLLAELLRAVEGHPEVTLAADRREGVIRVSAKGRSAHASHPTDSVNAAAVLARLLASCNAIPFDERAVMASAAMFAGDPYGGTLGIAGEDPAFGVRTAVVGMVRVKDGRLLLSEDIRYGVPSAELAPQLFEGVDGEDFEFYVASSHDAFDHGEDDAVAARLLEAFTRVTGDALPPYRSGGGTYARCLPRAYSFCVQYAPKGEAAEVDVPKGHGAPHTPDEYIVVDDLLLGMRILTEYTLTSAEILSNE